MGLEELNVKTAQMNRDLETREDLELLLSDFYKTAMTDNVIGHYFTKVVILDLEEHLPRIVSFWEKILFGKPVYFENPMFVHQKLHAKSPFEKLHFDRWVEIFSLTIDRLFTGTTAEKAKSKANNIAQSLLNRLLESTT